MDSRYKPTEASLETQSSALLATEAQPRKRIRKKFPWFYIVSRIALVLAAASFVWATWMLWKSWEYFRYSGATQVTTTLTFAMLIQTMRLIGAVLLVRRHSYALPCLSLMWLMRVGDILYSGQAFGFNFEPTFLYGIAVDTLYVMIAMWMYKTKTPSAPPSLRAE